MINFLKAQSKLVRFASALVISSAVFLSACSDSNDDLVASAAATQNIVEIASSTDRFSILTQAVVTAGLVDTLSGADKFTVFAPNNAAFQAYLDADPNDALTTSADILALPNLADILLYHVLPGEVEALTALQLASTDAATTASALGPDLALSISNESGADVLYVNTSKVIATDIFATNGVVHEIDKVILPASPKTANETSTITQIVTALGADTSPTGFSTLLAAVNQETAVATALSSAGPFTVFAPNNAAFQALLDSDPNDALATAGDILALNTLDQILLQHAVPGEIGSVAAYAANGLNVDTAQAGAAVTIDIQGGELFVEGSKVIATDIKASNGVIHVIDKVIVTVD